jgi:3-hydroxybutyryl-CoA dehydrogenase
MKDQELRKIAVVGVGQMGAGIAQVAAACGYEVLMHDVSSEVLNRAMGNIEKSLKKFALKGKIPESAVAETLERIQTTMNQKELSGVQMVIEAIPENEPLKKETFRELDQICGQETIFASNTSTIPIGRLSQAIRNPQRFIGMHFMNPVPLMKLVEIIRGFHTNDETVKVVGAIAEKMDKKVVYSKDFPGFIVNRVLMPMINEAIFALHEGVASAQDIDLAMKLGTTQPMGPLALADLIGLDTCLFIMEVIYEGLGDSKYRPCPLLRQYVEAGQFGRKTGRGFYEYSQD